MKNRWKKVIKNEKSLKNVITNEKSLKKMIKK